MSFRWHLNMFNDDRVTWCVVIWTWNEHIGTVLNRRSDPSGLENVIFLFPIRSTRIRSDYLWTWKPFRRTSGWESHCSCQFCHLHVLPRAGFIGTGRVLSGRLPAQSIFILVHHFGCATLHLLITPSNDKHSLWQCLLAEVSYVKKWLGKYNWNRIKKKNKNSLSMFTWHVDTFPERW